MTPKEYWKRICDTIDAGDTGKEAAEIIKDYVGFAIGEIEKVCNGNVSNKTVWMWVYALRKVSDILDSKTSERYKALMKIFDKCVKFDVMIATLPDLEGMDNAET
uniref:Uncharacterized protein n=1 Tax=Siphoviridae sp. ctiMP24 TaxID=2825621 RepID=A0A8S5NZ16_9CAUD|nr:MAG TPA: hypothetical protein [Siphoviridae sp. ctiMP24]